MSVRVVEKEEYEAREKRGGGGARKKKRGKEGEARMHSGREISL